MGVKILSGPGQRGLYRLGVGGVLGAGRQECRLGGSELPGSPVWGRDWTLLTLPCFGPSGYLLLCSWDCSQETW